MLEREIGERAVRAVHLGRPSPHKQRFASQMEPLASLRIFSDTTRARAVYLAGPVLRGQLRKLPWMVALQQKTRTLVPQAERAWGRARRLVSQRLERGTIS